MLAMWPRPSSARGRAGRRWPGSSALRHQPEDLALAFGEIVERDLRPPAPDELGDDLEVDDRAALGDPADRVREIVEIVDPILEQVSDAARPIGDQPERERRLDILRQDEDADRRAMLGADRPRAGLRRYGSAASDR